MSIKTLDDAFGFRVSATDMEIAEIGRCMQKPGGFVMYGRSDQMARSWPPTEKTLEWCRENIPHFKDCERQAKAARAREGGR